MLYITLIYYCFAFKELYSWKREDSSLSEVPVNQIQMENPFVKLLSISSGNISEVILIDSTGKVFLKSKIEQKIDSIQSPCSPKLNPR